MNSLDFLRQERIKAFIKENQKVDIQRLLLSPPSEFKDQIRLIADQILSRQKAVGKLNSWASNFDLIMPPPLSIEQASSATTGEYKSDLLSGDQFVDLTGGMGIDCLNIGRNFEKKIYVEKQQALAEVFKHNSMVLEESIEVHNENAEDFINSFHSEFNTVFYLDPARRSEEKKRVFRLEDCTPNIIELIPLIKKKGDKVLIKLSPLLDLSSIKSSLNFIKEIHVVSVKNECKELLIYLDFEFIGESKVVCVNLSSSQSPYAYNWSEEATSEAEFGEVSNYLYEPNASIMKAGAFKKLSKDFSVCKIAPNTHLYTSKEPNLDFPGRIFRITSLVDKKMMKQLRGKKINVLTRNHPLKAAELKAQLKIKDGGDTFLIAFRDRQEKAKAVISERLLF